MRCSWRTGRRSRTPKKSTCSSRSFSWAVAKWCWLTFVRIQCTVDRRHPRTFISALSEGERRNQTSSPRTLCQIWQTRARADPENPLLPCQHGICRGAVVEHKMVRAVGPHTKGMDGWLWNLAFPVIPGGRRLSRHQTTCLKQDIDGPCACSASWKFVSVQDSCIWYRCESRLIMINGERHSKEERWQPPTPVTRLPCAACPWYQVVTP